MGPESLSTLGEVFYNSMVGVLNFFVLVFVFRLAVSLIVNIGQVISTMKNQVKGKAGTLTANRNPSEETKASTDDSQELVYDEICGCEIPQQNSYIVATDDGYHYFCSWECRQKFVDSLNQIEAD
ncbi:MAG: hypothetical protein GX489_08130 [Firmicutes bacterium]|nr:hypothetical protein [Bacillota bacterium]